MADPAKLYFIVIIMVMIRNTGEKSKTLLAVGEVGNYYLESKRANGVYS